MNKLLGKSDFVAKAPSIPIAAAFGTLNLCNMEGTGEDMGKRTVVIYPCERRRRYHEAIIHYPRRGAALSPFLF